MRRSTPAPVKPKPKSEKKDAKESGQKIVPAFQTRKSLYDVVCENMLLMGRESFYQRMIILATNLDTDGFKEKLQGKLDEFIEKCQKENMNNEKITGVYLYYKSYSVIMLEGSEDVLGNFLILFATIEKEFYSNSKMLYVQDHVGKEFFHKFFWRVGESPIIMEQFSSTGKEQEEKQGENIVHKMYEFGQMLSNQLKNKEVRYSDEQLDSSYNRTLPEIQRIDFVLNSATDVYGISEFSKVYLKVPEIRDYDDEVWPVPYDYVPFGIFETSEYDVNLTFGNMDKQ